MRRVGGICLLPLLAVPLWGQAVAQDKPPVSAPGVLVGSFYEQIVKRHPLGMPSPADMKIFTPYLSKSLRHKIDLSVACLGDWGRKNPGPHLKPPSVLIENGLFSGANEEAEPKAFQIEKIVPEKSGATRVTVKLVWEDPYNKPYAWYVAAIVVPENGRLVVDDVLYLEHIGGAAGSRLSDDLSLGCSGANWVGRRR